GQRFASRGGDKLLSALEHFQVQVQGQVALDVGASSGGFTDCLLQHGAARVYAVDVGYGQLDWRLRSDSRVHNLERVNIRYAGPDLLPESVDLVVVDCSFISLRQVLPPSLQFLKPAGLLLALVKPQFELGRGRTDKGVVRSPALQEEAVQGVFAFANQNLGLACLGQVQAGLKGPKGNQEYFVLCSKPG
ncbi:MAG: TlyA family RNA methyltransferase, partial [Desulfohalobiaceae bacterium]